MGVLIGVQAFLSEFCVETELFKLVEDLLVDWDVIVSYHQALIGCWVRERSMFIFALIG